MIKKFWEVIFDDEKLTMEVVGTSTDDTRLTNNISEMQQAGMKVRCQTPDTSVQKDEITLSGYTFENNLYSRLLRDYEIKTQKRLKRW
jgi:hypothetical protein